MSSSNRSSAPLNRWKSRFWVFTKPMFWMSASILGCAGLLIADYYRVSISPDELAPSASDPEVALNEIPLSDDPELQELRDWEVAADAYENNDAAAIATIEDTATADPNVASDAENNGSIAEFRPEDFAIDTPLVNMVAEPDADRSDPDHSDARPEGDRQARNTTSLFSDYVTPADNVLERMGLNSPPPLPPATY